MHDVAEHGETGSHGGEEALAFIVLRAAHLSPFCAFGVNPTSVIELSRIEKRRREEKRKRSGKSEG